MKIDFNRQIKRKHTDCAKWDGQGGDYIPLWIVDMDLPVAEPVLEALKNRLEHPFLGYTFPGESVYQAVISYYEERQRVILHHSASKTYNIPGLPLAFAVIPNEELKHKYEEVAATMHAPFDTLSFIAFEAAFTKGEEWRQELLKYLRENKKWLDERISWIPGLSICHSEGTYLGWIDARETGVSDPDGFFMKEAGVKFNDGDSFSAPGFVRVNFACPRSYLEEAFDRVEKALQSKNV